MITRLVDRFGINGGQRTISEYEEGSYCNTISGTNPAGTWSVPERLK